MLEAANVPAMAVLGDEALLVHAVDALAALIPAAIVLAFTVDDRGLADRTAAVRSNHGTSAESFVDLLRRLEPIDPFSPRRAQASGATVMSAAEFGGHQRFRSSMYGGHLFERGFGSPIFMYLRRDGAIAAVVALLRERHAAPFDAATTELLRRLVPLLERSPSVAAGAYGGASAAEAAPDRALTRRQRQVAGLVAGGSSNADIARALAMSQATVKAHLTKIYAKAGVRTRTQLAVVLGAADGPSSVKTFG